ncbi:unnamed protein product, partial [Hydatigera taeniaeformis]|uniref:Innexin n=1 Tax=Hydatigena taeniaeformis TaxID=6205 RepID=A0A0R3WXQ0_HYDTA
MFATWMECGGSHRVWKSDGLDRSIDARHCEAHYCSGGRVEVYEMRLTSTKRLISDAVQTLFCTTSLKCIDSECNASFVLFCVILGFIGICMLIPANVPILRFCDDESGIKCDLNVNNVEGLYNTHLLAMYARVDSRLTPLGMFVKHWAQNMDIHGADRGRLSTYALLLMLIHFLQCGCSPPVLPNLQARFPVSFGIGKAYSWLLHNMEGERHLSRWHYYPPDQ